MQLLIVHRDPEMGEALVQMIRNYTRHHAQLVESDKVAIDWARRHQRCELLLVQLEAAGIDGLALGSSLSEIFPALQVLFFPNYNAADRRLEVAPTKVFPEPIEGDDLLGAIERAENIFTKVLGPERFCESGPLHEFADRRTRGRNDQCDASSLGGFEQFAQRV